MFVWDLPLRVFHWSLVATVVTCVVSAEMGGNAMEWHAISGYVAIGLLLFRFMWAFLGGTYSRFSSYLDSHQHIVAWLRGSPATRPGYTPMGTIALIVMFTVLWAQGVSGLFANDDIMLEGPLYHLVSQHTADWLTAWHKRGFYIVCGLVALHVSAILIYRFVKKIDYIRPMITGYKELPEDTPRELEGRPGSLALALVLAALSAATVWYVVTQL